MHIIKNPFLVFSVCFSVLMLILAVFIGVSAFEGQAGKLIINFDGRGLPVLGEAVSIFSLFGILAAMIAINSVLVFQIYNRERFLSYVLSATTIIVSLLILIATSMVVSMN
ncbi:MAG: hypothetical protein A3B23_04055 [Candidatus Colwellbacteria bacterium RIFCSPLOWO2_01_FULL_48_10]|uniref:Uncharacterized protein n=1 Tax=Candidatus Colwellbacteria bacterium RIFCSPLOWO2_01_FULL_48_10 TaxID=1797690 RepID=A0A1G1Z6P0_9BACT|nr:MAG: hypothetical protein A3B23_04055 [Candidatus Colwellbacteria bacterium RIFCSPLOWO2_01_FULL_48_10]